MIHLNVGSGTDVGRRRSLNEDSMLIGQQVFVVADGMGGHAAGDVASAIVIDSLRIIDGELVSADAVRAAVGAANTAVLRYAAEHPDAAGLGTTVTGMALLASGGAPHWVAFNVGDSRVYDFAGGRLRQVSVDHSEVGELMASGYLTAAEARVHPSRNIITRAIGEYPSPEVDTMIFPAEPGHRFLLCSDGLTTEVEDEEIASILGAHHPAQATVDALIRRALECGGRDNVTVVVIDTTSTDEEGSAAAPTTVPRPTLEGDLP